MENKNLVIIYGLLSLFAVNHIRSMEDQSYFDSMDYYYDASQATEDSNVQDDEWVKLPANDTDDNKAVVLFNSGQSSAQPEVSYVIPQFLLKTPTNETFVGSNSDDSSNLDKSKAVILFTPKNFGQIADNDNINAKDQAWKNKMKSLVKDKKFQAGTCVVVAGSALGGLYAYRDSLKEKYNALANKVKAGINKLTFGNVAKAGAGAVAATAAYLGFKKLNSKYQINDKAKGYGKDAYNYVKDNKAAKYTIMASILGGGVSLIGWKAYGHLSNPLSHSQPQQDGLEDESILQWQKELGVLIDSLNDGQISSMEDIEELLNAALSNPSILNENQNFLDILNNEQKEQLELVNLLYAQSQESSELGWKKELEALVNSLSDGQLANVEGAEELLVNSLENPSVLAKNENFLDILNNEQKDRLATAVTLYESLN